MEHLTQVLLNVFNPATREQSEQFLKSAEQANYPMFLLSLAGELANNEKPSQARGMAGLILKNALYAKESPERQLQLNQQWLALDPTVRTQIKQMAFATLSAADAEARNSATQLVARIGVCEIPVNQWPELINELLKNMKLPSEQVRMATLQCLGYLCQDMPGTYLAAFSNPILQAVVTGMAKDQNEQIRLYATRALFNALEFARRNLETDSERNYVMKIICEATQSADPKVRQAAFECLVKVAGLYYRHLGEYMEAIFSLTFNAIRSDPAEEVSQMALEFWATLCEEEIDLANEWAEYNEDRENNDPPAVPSAQFIEKALKFMVPLLTEVLMTKDENQDPDEWNKVMAAGHCLSLFAQNVGDSIVDHLMPFVRDNINHPTRWQNRDAAMLAFGSILEGPSKEKLAGLVEMSVPRMLEALKDPSLQVKDTAAWTIGQICELHPESIGTKLFEVMGALYEALSDVPRVANNVCWALHNIAKADPNAADDSKPTNHLSPYFPKLIQKLMETSAREDADENNLRMSAYSAVNVMIQNAAPDVFPDVLAVVPTLIQRLTAALGMTCNSTEDREEQYDLIALLCGVVQVILQRCGGLCRPVVPQLMGLFVQVINAHSATVQEEVLLCIGSVASILEAGFEEFLPHFMPFIQASLQNYQAHSVVECAVGVVGDIVRGLEKRVVNISEQLIGLLLEALRAPALNPKVKPSILSALGDVAMYVGQVFVRHLPAVMGMCRDASQTQVDLSNPDQVAYLNELREAIFDCYTGILQGLRSEHQGDIFLQYVESVVAFITIVEQDEDRYDGVTRSCVGVIGDLASTLGSKVRSYMHKDFVKHLIRDAINSPDAATKQIGEWAKEMIKPI
ncbi:putative Importin subunit beta-1 [Paratrimastix pyriformis]|uniref:Importin subunit beta-1 n=1 Tax=Paratrimastix pyriformis TaxID=342808 RepID=A0ABQ8USY4_9EUKA|nr:putative Importin subunit beta-1 [Paratrimastix pyriformis]|eukprot:GAFH01000820.1.p2 GENE.GAFH01000820.1~~GAFH01000820.1.p2  ORF type:complete len:867 (-),score=378.10 GAFH01000820.1:159-2729(-)